jgi:adenylylsulfate kinase
MGVSGAGKTTIGRGVAEYFKQSGEPYYFLDSDELRDLFDRDLGYTREDRIANIKRVMAAAYVLERSGINVIVCNVSYLESMRQLARRKLPGYREIYLKRDIGSAVKNDTKGMYKNNLGKTDIIGIDTPYEPPLSPDLVLDTDLLTEEETLARVIKYIQNIK